MSRWIDNLMPNEYVASIYDIDFERLRGHGKKLILTDLDNTLVPWNHPAAPEKLMEWFRHAQTFGFTVCILSNNKGNRVGEFSKKTGIPAISRAKKPSPLVFRQAMKRFGARVDETIMVGDQLLTDVQGGNLAGLYTILVLPIHPKEYWGTKVNRKIERFFMKRLIRRGLVRPDRR